MGAGCTKGKQQTKNQQQQQQVQQPQNAQNNRQHQQQVHNQQQPFQQPHQNQRLQHNQTLPPQHMQQNGQMQQGQMYNQQQQQQQQQLMRSHTGYMPQTFNPKLGPMPVSKVTVIYNKLSIRQKSVKLIKNDDDKWYVEFEYDCLLPSNITTYFFINEKMQFFHNLTLEIQPHPQFNNNLIPEIFQINEQNAGTKLKYTTKTGLHLDQLNPVQLKSKQENGNNFWPFMIKMEQINPRQVIFAYCEFQKHGEKYEIKIVNQRIEINQQAYDVQQIYGINNTQLVQGEPVQDEHANEENTNKECIICFTDLIDTVIMPCRHMCICMECAKSIQQQKQKSKKNCPICRNSIESFLRIKKEEKQ